MREVYHIFCQHRQSYLTLYSRHLQQSSTSQGARSLGRYIFSLCLSESVLSFEVAAVLCRRIGVVLCRLAQIHVNQSEIIRHAVTAPNDVLRRGLGSAGHLPDAEATDVVVTT